METQRDSYRTIAATAEVIYKEKSSKFITYAYHVESEEKVAEILSGLRKKYYDATHHCYAWRMGAGGEMFRSNDDGEPSGTAGKPIYGQLLSHDITDCLIVVIRYFGGTKLGVGGLITAYKQSAMDVIEVAEIVERTVNSIIKITFSYIVMNSVMKVIKELQPVVESQNFDNLCSMQLSIRKSGAESLIGKLGKIDGCSLEIN